MTPGLQGWWEINEEYVDFLSVLSCPVSIYIKLPTMPLGSKQG